jgi:hypothetical protein
MSEQGAEENIRTPEGRNSNEAGEKCIMRSLYASPKIIRTKIPSSMRSTGHLARICEKLTAYRFLVGKSKGKRPLGRPRCSWENNVEMVAMA